MTKFKKGDKVLTRGELKKEYPNVCFPRDMERAKDWLAEQGIEKHIEPPAPPQEPSGEVAESPIADLQKEVAELRAIVEDMKVKK